MAGAPNLGLGLASAAVARPSKAGQTVCAEALGSAVAGTPALNAPTLIPNPSAPTLVAAAIRHKAGLHSFGQWFPRLSRGFLDQAVGSRQQLEVRTLIQAIHSQFSQ